MKNIETIFLKLMREAIAPHGAEEAEALAKKVAEIIPSDAESGAVSANEGRAVADAEQRAAESGGAPAEGERRLIALAKAQDMSYCLRLALKRIGARLSERGEAILCQEENIQLFRYMKLVREFAALTASLDGAGFTYMPLKGSVIRKLYPSPEMRVSSDIDILVHEGDLDAIIAFMRDELEYEIGRRDLYDVSTYSPSGVHVEVHFRLTSEEERYDAALTQVWETSLPDGCETRRVMSPEIEMVYAVMHTAKHFHNGGCGARFLMDLYILKNKLHYDEQSVLQTLGKCRLDTFYHEIMHLSDVWFGDAEHTDLTARMQDYILGAGIYGNMENKVAVFRSESGGRFKYTMKRLFPPKDTLALYYPRLTGAPLLYPYYAVKRWIRVLFKNRKSAIGELKSTAAVTDKRSDEIMDMLGKLDLLVKAD